jgi:hypothetical protein
LHRQAFARQTGADPHRQAEIAEPDVISPSFIQTRSAPTPKNFCSWIYREYLVFLCGLRVLGG